jgi:hypothetical protein
MQGPKRIRHINAAHMAANLARAGWSLSRIEDHLKEWGYDSAEVRTALSHARKQRRAA